jgi:hypothetical protein
MSQLAIEAVAKRIMVHGPDRVVISGAGEAVGSKRAREQYGISAEIVFIRDDGWSLGAPLYFKDVAESLWADHWIGVMERPSTKAMAYAAWKAGQE